MWGDSQPGDPRTAAAVVWGKTQAGVTGGDKDGRLERNGRQGRGAGGRGRQGHEKDTFCCLFLLTNLLLCIYNFKNLKKVF